jgi:hypothetical protein
MTLYEGPDKNIWVGAFNGGLHLYDSVNKNFIRYNTIIGYPPGFNNNACINAILQDSYGNLWVGSDGLGLCLFNKVTKTFITPFKHDENKNSISSNNVLAIFEDSKKRLWIGTRGGLNLFDYKKNEFTAFHKKDGLPGEQIPGILEDDHGNLWLSTNNGISQFNVESKTFKNFGTSDGLQSKEFTRNAFLKSRTGIMYFGGPNGFNEFHPDSIKEKPFDPPLLITDFLLFNKPVIISDNEDESPLQRHISETKAITLPYTSSVFSFEFASLNFTSAEKKRYAYKMEGFDKDWNYIGTSHTATYTNLDGGSYVFKVKGLNNQGEWSSRMATIFVTITPPFWMTWWFRILAASLFIASADSF